MPPIYIQGADGKLRGSIPGPVQAPTPVDEVLATPAATAAPVTGTEISRIYANYQATQPRATSAAPSVTRSEGYRLGSPKEAAGIECAQEFLSRLLGVPVDGISLITGADDNYRYGDLRLPSGKTVEVKRQSINPDRYPMNFVEVAELTFNPRHSGGASMLARTIGVETDQLAASAVRDFRFDDRPSAPLGRPDYLSVSLTSIAGSAATIYVNPDAGHIYVYRSAEIMDHVRRGVLNNNLRRGQGKSNDDSLAVLVPLSRWRFSLDKNGKWRYVGVGTPEAEKNELRNHLG